MMRKISSLLLIWAAGLLTACGGGGGSDSDVFRQGTPAGTVTPNVATVTVTSNKVSILSDGSESATITAFVRDSSNRLLEGVPVTFASSSGGVSPPTANTGADGTATATLVTAGDSTLRNITVTATAGGVNGTVAVPVVAAQPPVAVGTLTLSTSTPTIPSDNSNPATITAVVQDTSNRFVSGVPVVFTTSSGGIAVNQATTNASGAATATLSTPNDPTNRTITVTAVAGGITRTVTVNVIGSRLSIQGPNALVLGASAQYTVSLVDSADRGIAGRALTVSSARGNTLSSSSLTTDPTGRATFNVTATSGGNDTLTITGLGLTGTQPVSVNADSFTFTTPALNAEVPLSTPTTVTVRWLQNGQPVAAGTPVTFTTTRGTVTGSPALTNASGDATVTVSSTTAGGANLVASGGGATAQRAIEFVASTAASIDAQASTATVGIGEQSTITAVVRDPTGNLVKNKTVTFTLTDNTGGTLSVASAITNSQGRAQTVYTAGSSVSARDGVDITASVAGAGGTPITDSVKLTVARKEVFITLGTGNSVEETNPAQYKITFTVALTDANGNGVPNVPVTMSILTDRYLKGTRAFLNGSWANYAVPVYNCQDEDTLVPATARNGQLDPGEDADNDGRIDVGNIALASPSQVTTNAQGVALVDVLYPQDVALWLQVTLEARAAVQGTEFSRSSTFLLPGTTSDFNNQNVSPPGPTSPFGVNTCSTNN
jgi:hypothetical protein